VSARTALADVDAALAGAAPLPRDNGALVFEEPWQGRVLGMGVVALERTGSTWSDFRPHLVAAIERHPYAADESPATAYYTAFVEALESFLAEVGGIVAPPQAAPISAAKGPAGPRSRS
jgi:nitrile hydratase accessory protein